MDGWPAVPPARRTGQDGAVDSIPSRPPLEKLQGRTRLSSDAAPSSTTATAMSLPPASAGRWRLEVIVPRADVQDVLPAAQLLSTVGGGTGGGGGRDYNAAKAEFLSVLERDGLVLDDIRVQVGGMVRCWAD